MADRGQPYRHGTDFRAAFTNADRPQPRAYNKPSNPEFAKPYTDRPRINDKPTTSNIPNNMQLVKSNTNWAVSEPALRAEPAPRAAPAPKVKKAKTSWGVDEAEMKRRKRVARYKAYAIEGKLKATLRKGVKWIKSKCSMLVHGH